ncbi:MAG: hypothetical protein ACFFCZ_12370 [Promethearchaeota archaeon]
MFSQDMDVLHRKFDQATSKDVNRLFSFLMQELIANLRKSFEGEVRDNCNRCKREIEAHHSIEGDIYHSWCALIILKRRPAGWVKVR